MSLSMRQSIISLNILNLYLIQSNNEYSDQTRTGVFHMIWLCNPKFKINRMCKNNLIICFSHRTNTEIFLKNMRRPGIEPGSTAWKAAMLTTIPPTLLQEDYWYQSGCNDANKFNSIRPRSTFINYLRHKTPWRNGSASDSRSEGCVFESRRGQLFYVKNKKSSFQKILSDCRDQDSNLGYCGHNAGS